MLRNHPQGQLHENRREQPHRTLSSGPGLDSGKAGGTAAQFNASRCVTMVVLLASSSNYSYLQQGSRHTHRWLPRCHYALHFTPCMIRACGGCCVMLAGWSLCMPAYHLLQHAPLPVAGTWMDGISRHQRTFEPRQTIWKISCQAIVIAFWSQHFVQAGQADT
jgi:hypothetical protein